MKRLFASLLMLHGLALPARAEGVSVKVGNFPGFGRVVFDVPADVEFQLVEEVGRAILVITGSPTVPAPAGLPRNFVVLEGGAGAATLVFKPGARVRTSRVGQRVIVDALDPVRGSAQARRPTAAVVPVAASVEAPGKPVIKAVPQVVVEDATPGRVPEALPATPVSTPPISATPVKANTDAPIAATPLPPLDAPAAPVQPDAAEAAAPARAVAMQDRGRIVMVPTGADVGAAAFRRGDQAVIVLDGRATAGIAGLDSVGPHRATVTEGHDTTVVTMPLPAPAVPRLTRTAKGWNIAIEAAPAGMDAKPDDMLEPSTFKLEAPGRVVSVLDPATGQPLLVGTSRQAGSGTGVRTGQRTPGHSVLPTWQGVAIEPLSDQVRLLPTPGGFKLEAAGTLQAAATAPPDQLFTRKFDLPAMTVPAHLNRLHAQVAAAAAAPPVAAPS